MDSEQPGGPSGRPPGQGDDRPDGDRRRNRNRSRNRNRNRNREGGSREGFENRGPRSNQGHNGGNRSGGGNRPPREREDRERSPRRAPAPPPPTLGQRILSIVTFGLLGKPKAPAPAPRGEGRTGNREERPRRENREGRENRGEGRENRPPREPREERPPREPREPKPARTPRPPVTVEVTSPRLYVGNLDYEVGEQELEDLFRGVGNVASAEIVTNPRTQQSKGFAFVVMGHIDEARRAVEVLHDKDFMGRKLLVTGAKNETAESESGTVGESEGTGESAAA